MLKTLIAAFALLVLAGLATEARPQSGGLPCGKRLDMAAALRDHWSEARFAGGLAGPSAVVEFFKSPAGSWTMMVTTANGVTCIYSAGDNWQDMGPVEGMPAPKPKGSDKNT